MRERAAGSGLQLPAVLSYVDGTGRAPLGRGEDVVQRRSRRVDHTGGPADDFEDPLGGVHAGLGRDAAGRAHLDLDSHPRGG